jgi:hypothetical protein
MLLKSKSWKEERRKHRASVHGDFDYDDPDEFEGIG